MATNVGTPQFFRVFPSSARLRLDELQITNGFQEPLFRPKSLRAQGFMKQFDALQVGKYSP